MADVITRFKLETTQYDSKLRDAAKGLKDFLHQAELGGKGFNQFSQKSIEAARALGTVASGATNLKDKVKDLVGAYNDAAKAYNNLTKEQQQSDFGKALSQSIGQLSERIKEAKQELYGLGQAAEKIKSGSLFGEGGLTGLLAVTGGNILASGITKLGSELADTIKQSVELARSGEGVRLAFDRLNRPDLLSNLKEATHGTVSELELMKAAVKFDDFKLPVEELGTLLAFAQKKAKDTGQSVDYMVDSIVTGLGRKSLMILDNLGLSAAQIKEKMKEGGDMTKAVADIIKEQMTEAGEYVETAADRAARAAAEASDKMEKLGREAMPVAEEWANAWNEIRTAGMEVLTTVLGPIADSIRSIRELLSGEFELKIKANIPNLANGPVSPWGKTTPGRDHIVQAPGGYVVMTDTNTGAVIGGQHFDNLNDRNAITDWQKKLFKTPKTGGGSNNSAKIQNSWNAAFAKSVSGAEKLKPSDYIEQPSIWKEYGQEIVKSMNETGDSFEQAINKLSLDNWSGDAEVLNFLKKFAKYGDDTAQSWQAAAGAIKSVGSAVSGLDDNAGKIISIIGEAIANIAAAAGIATKKAAGKSVHWTEYIGAAAGIIGSMVSAISVIHSSTGYAEGGRVEGSTYSGDQIPIMANAGEVILNQAQQSNVAHALQGGAFGGMKLTARLDGKDLLLSIDRTGQTLGYGQLVFFH